MCNCGKSKNNVSRTTVVCPNKRLRLGKLAQKALKKAEYTNNEDSKTSLTNIANDINTYLNSNTSCPELSYINSINKTIDGFQ